MENWYERLCRIGNGCSPKVPDLDRNPKQDPTEGIFRILLANIRKIGGKSVEGRPVLAIINGDKEDLDQGEWDDHPSVDTRRFQVQEETQSGEVLCSPDLGIDFVNVWLRDYCDVCNSRVEVYPESISMLVRDGESWRVPAPFKQADKPKKKFLFSSSYGGDGIKLPVIGKLSDYKGFDSGGSCFLNWEGRSYWDKWEVKWEEDVKTCIDILKSRCGTTNIVWGPYDCGLLFRNIGGPVGKGNWVVRHGPRFVSIVESSAQHEARPVKSLEDVIQQIKRTQ